MEQQVHTHVKPLLYSCIVFVAVLLSCNQAPKENIIVRNLDADRKYIIRDKGLTYYKQDLYTGKLTHYYPDSAKKSITTLYKGKMHGKYTLWWNNGNLRAIRYYKNNNKDSINNGWYKNGNPKFKYNFIEGKYNGTQTEYYDNGKIFSIKNYTNGIEDGAFKVFNIDGTLRSNYVTKKGKRYGLIGLKPCSSPITE